MRSLAAACVFLVFRVLHVKRCAGRQRLTPAGTERSRNFLWRLFLVHGAAVQDVPGVISVTSGYTGGTVPNPSYEQVSEGDTGHAESIQVIYDPTQIDYEKLLDTFWHNIDPTTPKRQFCDSGDQYRTAIFFDNETQKQLAEASRDALQKSGVLKGAKIVTEITPASAFYPAEEFHQDYYRKQRSATKSIAAVAGAISG